MRIQGNFLLCFLVLIFLGCDFWMPSLILDASEPFEAFEAWNTSLEWAVHSNIRDTFTLQPAKEIILDFEYLPPEGLWVWIEPILGGASGEGLAFWGLVNALPSERSIPIKLNRFGGTSAWFVDRFLADYSDSFNFFRLAEELQAKGLDVLSLDLAALKKALQSGVFTARNIKERKKIKLSELDHESGPDLSECSWYNSRGELIKDFQLYEGWNLLIPEDYELEPRFAFVELESARKPRGLWRSFIKKIQRPAGL